MELIQWTGKYLTGIKEIDNQHKGLVLIINELFSLMSIGKAKDNMNEIFAHLTDYTKKHFVIEETMLIKFAYKDFQDHKEEHKKFIAKLDELHKDFDKGNNIISVDFLNFLKDWLLNHILISDKKYAPYILDQDS